MTEWLVKTLQRKSVEEHELWQKDDLVIRKIVGFRHAEFYVTTEDENPPVLDQFYGPGADAVDMYNLDYECSMKEMLDGWYQEFIWPDDMPNAERDRLEQLWDEDSYEGWETEGWRQYETECWLRGELGVEKVATHVF